MEKRGIITEKTPEVIVIKTKEAKDQSNGTEQVEIKDNNLVSKLIQEVEKTKSKKDAVS
jgi:hypothetical protein